MNEIGQAFIARSRYHLQEDYLPKIERCLALLSDEQIWWRANEQSNSVGNLLLHLNGNVRQWILGSVGGQTDVRHRAGEFAARTGPPAAALLADLDRTLDEVHRVLAALTDADLLQPRTIQ